MKKILYSIFAVIASSVAVSSCNFLDEPLRGAYTSEDYYSSPEKAEMAVNAVYNSLYGHNLWVFADVASDDAEKGGTPGDQADINYIADFTAAADNGPLSQYWQHTYETIARANNVVNFVGAMNFDEALKNRYVAEAKVLRAYMYFQLVNIFGQVPLKLMPQNSSENIHVGLSTVKDIYTQIDKDLEEAIPALSVSYAAEAGRITKGAALAFLAKSKLFQKEYAACAKACDDLFKLNQYSLEDNFADLFCRGGENSKESIFALRYIKNETAALSNNLVVWFAPAIVSGYYFNAPTQAFVDNFTEQTVEGEVDPRLDASIGRDGQPWFNGLTFNRNWSPTGYLVKKFGEDLPEGEAIGQSTMPQHILRYADVLLMWAEALNEDGKAGAAEHLNEVRSRAGLADTQATSQADLRNAIRVERRRELGFEFHRFFDVVRYGKEYAKSVLPDFPWDTDRYYFPLPQAETDVNTSINK